MKHKSITFSFILIIISVISSCSQPTLKEELREWCACEELAADFPEKSDSCTKLMDEIAQKHEFDPESLPEIEQAVKNCK